ncbi:MAG: anti-sigma factor, partial [Kiritimatiellia bacterium]|nr:anti-sigma factor [Kiritimatiellia bacterium]
NAVKIMVECRQIRQMLASDYMDNELDPPAREQVDRHLEKCPDCRKISANLVAITLPLRRAPRVNVPQDLWPRIQTELRRQHSPAARPKTVFRNNIREFFLIRPAFAAAAAAAAAILIIISAVVYLPTQRTAGVGAAPDLSSLTGNIEIREQHAGFGSCIEQLLL